MGKNEELLKKLRAGNFVENNGKVLQDINILRHDYIALKSVWQVNRAVMSEQQFLDCIHFLSREGYIELQLMGTERVVKLAHHDYKTLEAIVTGKGIRLLGGELSDRMVGGCYDDE